MRLRWSGDLPAIERTAEVACPVEEVYAEFRREDEPNSAVLLVRDEPPRLLEWELNMRGLRDARLQVTIEPVEGAEPARTRVTSRLEARVVGRLRRRRGELAESYGAVVESLLERTCAALDEPQNGEEPTPTADG